MNVKDIAQHMSKTIAFRQLNDNKDLLENADYLKEWPIQEADSKEQLRIKKGVIFVAYSFRWKKTFEL